MPAGGPKYDFATISAPGTEPKIHSIFDFTAEALEQLAFWLEQRGIHTPISQILGFSQFTAQSAAVFDVESTTSTSYTSLATSGPTISGLGPGKYLVLVSAYMRTESNSIAAYMSYSVNSTSPSDHTAAVTANTDGAKLVGIGTETLTGDNNNIAALYKIEGASTGHFSDRNLIVLKYGN